MIERFIPRELGKKPWGVEILVAQTGTYIGKILKMNAGCTGPLQHHVQKDETFYIFSGEVIVEYIENGVRTQTKGLPGDSFHIPPGAVHRVEAIQPTVMFEASTPHFDDRVPYGDPE